MGLLQRFPESNKAERLQAQTSFQEICLELAADRRRFRGEPTDARFVFVGSGPDVSAGGDHRRKAAYSPDEDALKPVSVRKERGVWAVPSKSRQVNGICELLLLFLQLERSLSTC